MNFIVWRLSCYDQENKGLVNVKTGVTGSAQFGQGPNMKNTIVALVATTALTASPVAAASLEVGALAEDLKKLEFTDLVIGFDEDDNDRWSYSAKSYSFGDDDDDDDDNDDGGSTTSTSTSGGGSSSSSSSSSSSGGSGGSSGGTDVPAPGVLGLIGLALAAIGLGRRGRRSTGA